MKVKVIDANEIREMCEHISLSQCDEYLGIFAQRKDKLVKVGNRVTAFLQMVKEWGYSSPTDFLIEGGIIPNPNVKRPRTKINDDTRKQIVEDLKSGTLSTNEISLKYGVTADSVYNIKGKAGLTRPRLTMVLTQSVTQPTPPPAMNPATVPTPPPVVLPAKDQIAA